MEHAALLPAMLTADPQSLVGTTVLSDLRVDSLIRVDAALATYAATSQPDGMECTLRVALGVPLPEEKDSSIASAMQRIARHTVGIFAICTPKSAGPVVLGSDRLLAVAHLGPPGENAEDRIASSQPMVLREVLAYLEPIAAALTTLHDQGLVHGALHPGAIRLALSGPILSGFGLSELAMILGGSGAGRDIVPPRSRVPEQVGIVPASPVPESDTYALAMIACELLAGRPFTSETDTSSIARAIDHPMMRPTPKSLSVDVPDHVDKAFEIALRPQPRERTHSPKEFLAAVAAPAAPGPPRSERQPVHEQPPPLSVPRHEPARPSAESPRPQRSAFGAPPAAPVEQPKADSAVWLVYAMIALGVLLLIGGAATVFVLAQHRVPPPVVPVASAPPIFPAPPPPTLIPSSPAPTPDPEPTASVAPSSEPLPPLASPSPSGSALKPPAPSGLAYYPDDLTALVPLAKETPTLGSRDALVTILVFADMQCPHTRQAREVLEAMRRRYDADLRIAVRHLPIPSHDKAEDAAELAATAGALSGPIAFWKLFETLTVNQGRLTDDDMLQWAEQAGAPRMGVRRALEEHVYRRIVEADRAVAQRLMVRATPAFFVNGKRADGEQSQAKMVELIDKELLASRGALLSGTPRSRLYSTRVTFNVTAGAADPPREPAPRRRP